MGVGREDKGGGGPLGGRGYPVASDTRLRGRASPEVGGGGGGGGELMHVGRWRGIHLTFLKTFLEGAL